MYRQALIPQELGACGEYKFLLIRIGWYGGVIAASDERASIQYTCRCQHAPSYTIITFDYVLGSATGAHGTILAYYALLQSNENALPRHSQPSPYAGHLHALQRRDHVIAFSICYHPF